MSKTIDKIKKISTGNFEVSYIENSVKNIKKTELTKQIDDFEKAIVKAEEEAGIIKMREELATLKDLLVAIKKIK